MIVALEEAKRRLTALFDVVGELKNQLRIDEAKEKCQELERETLVQDFWNDAEKSSKKLREIKQLKDACMHIRYRHTVYNEWGFGKKAAYGRGLSILFSGPPGTGKTMAAQVVTNQLHMKLYKVQLSQIISKYIGETEKNLKKVFTEAKNANCVLFFDEMDALFGKRSEVKDSHDRHANIETAYLLQQMEEYDGVVLMATNLLQNIDEAFMRRISFVVSFPFPDVATRALLWKKMFDANAPMSEDVDYDFLAEAFKISSIPAILFIPKDGTPQMLIGLRDKATLKGEIDTILLGK